MEKELRDEIQKLEESLAVAHEQVSFASNQAIELEVIIFSKRVFIFKARAYRNEIAEGGVCNPESQRDK